MIRHGYTLTDIDNLARTATRTSPAGGIDAYTRYTLAWSGIAEALLAEQPPARRELLAAGRTAITAELAACLHARGYRDGHVYNGPASSPRYMRYWTPVGDESAVDRLVDHIAAQQAGEVFTAAQGAAVAALAATDDHQAAAELLGIGYGTFSTRLSEARRVFRRVWFAPDAPPAVPRHDKRRGNQPPRARCTAGHPMTGDNVRVRTRRGGKTERVCRACDRARGLARRAAELLRED